MENSISDSSIEWEDVLINLTAYVRSLTKRYIWFRGVESDSFLKGKEVKDYVYEAILKYLESPEKYNPNKGSLTDYLKYNIIRNLVRNDCNSEENKLHSDVFAKHIDSDNEDDSGSYLDRILPCFEPMFPDDIDYNSIRAYIEEEIKDEVDLENIFLGLYGTGMKRAEIIEEFGMESKVYDNGVRRLQTIIRKAATHFKTNQIGYEKETK